MKCCIFSLHKKGGHILNEWLAHLYNPQLTKITTVVGPEGVPCYHQPQGFLRGYHHRGGGPKDLERSTI